MPGKDLPGFTQFVLSISDAIAHNFIVTAICVAVFVASFVTFVRTRFGRRIFDKFKLNMPVLGSVISKVAISRFTRTLGTLVSSGVPILQALTIVKETSGNVIVGAAVSMVHESVKEGETITAPLEHPASSPRWSSAWWTRRTDRRPAGNVDEIADNYDEEVDNAVAAMTSLLEPIMIVFLAVIVGSIVIALFLPLIALMEGVTPLAAARTKKVAASSNQPARTASHFI